MGRGKKIIEIIKKLPCLTALYRNIFLLMKNPYVPAGHYYSPLISVKDIKNRENEIWSKSEIDGVKGLDLNKEQQNNLVQALSKYYHELPFKAEKQPNLRYHFDNSFYSYTDGIMPYSMIRHFNPKRIVEVGSSFSSAIMLDTNDLFFNNQIELTFIEPYSERLLSLLTEIDKKNANIIQCDVQSVSMQIFEKLEKGDILFIDSSHVAKTGSDVNYILFEILPALKSGVLIHFHDVFYPFEYPKEWVFSERNWNEDYF